MNAIKIIPLLWLLSGCAVIQPWEREYLSDPVLIFDENPVEKIKAGKHREYREGSGGGTGAQGGGCGCG